MQKEIKVTCYNYTKNGIYFEDLTQKAKEIFGDSFVKEAYLIDFDKTTEMLDKDTIDIGNRTIGVLFSNDNFVVFSSSELGYISNMEYRESVEGEKKCIAKEDFSFNYVDGKKTKAKAIQKGTVFYIHKENKKMFLAIKNKKYEIKSKRTAILLTNRNKV